MARRKRLAGRSDQAVFFQSATLAGNGYSILMLVPERVSMVASIRMLKVLNIFENGTRGFVATSVGRRGSGIAGARAMQSGFPTLSHQRRGLG
jgi:hypothetical protein